jgi:hypothetical protein
VQAFPDYAFDGHTLSAAEIRAQIDAAADSGASGWMLWNPRNRYSTAGLHEDAIAPAPTGAGWIESVSRAAQ